MRRALAQCAEAATLETSTRRFGEITDWHLQLADENSFVSV
jgi:hypothetical protein